MCGESEQSGDRRVGVERQRSKVDHLAARERHSLFFEMAPTDFVKKTGSIPESKLAKTRKPQLPPELVGVSSSDDEEESGEGEDVEEDEGLGEVSDSGEEGEGFPEEDDGAGEGGSGSGPEDEQGESSGDEDVLALDELEDVELHPDAVPRRGVKVVDNKVRAARIQSFSYFIFRCLGCSREDQKNDPARPQTAVDRNPRRLIPGSSYCRPRR